MVSPALVHTDLFRVGKPEAVIEAIAGQNPNDHTLSTRRDRTYGGVPVQFRGAMGEWTE
ncbi:hypothetical protein H2248_011558 [Termitomyces sp. 'cryptogamus']|nr:hypothetical protein H2248_011558 [Termitomyces sp. 'cryptogamus']